MWLPGVYENARAAYRAFKFPDEMLQKMQDNANKRAGGTGGIITNKDLDICKISKEIYV